jgi:hypothetical protein
VRHFSLAREARLGKVSATERRSPEWAPFLPALGLERRRAVQRRGIATFAGNGRRDRVAETAEAAKLGPAYRVILRFLESIPHFIRTCGRRGRRWNASQDPNSAPMSVSLIPRLNREIHRTRNLVSALVRAAPRG